MLRSAFLWSLALVFASSFSPAALAVGTDVANDDTLSSDDDASVKVAKRRRSNTRAEDAEASGDVAPDEIAPDAELLSAEGSDTTTSDHEHTEDPAQGGHDHDAHAENPTPARTKLTSREIADTVLPSVVTIIAERRGRVVGQGSGFFVAQDLVATNFHVIAKADAVYIALPEEDGMDEDDSGVPFAGIAALTPDVDLVVLKISKKQTFTRPALPLANEAARPGDPIFAVGTPQGLSATFSDGMVSSVRGDEKNIIQITAPISAGSSGGPVVDEYGEVAGIVVAKHTGGDNLGFAIATSELKTLLANQQKQLVDFDESEDRLDDMLQARERKDDGGAKGDSDDYEDYEDDVDEEEGGIGIGWIIGGVCGVCGVCGACGAGSVGACVGLQCVGIVLGSLSGGGGGAAAIGALGISALGIGLALAGTGLAGYTALNVQADERFTTTTMATGATAGAALIVGTAAAIAGGALAATSLLEEEGDERPKKPAREYGPVTRDLTADIAH